MKTDSIGTNADVAASVDISKVHGGYFADPKNIAMFVKLGIAPIARNIPKIVKYVDFGGGQGHLTIGVKTYLESMGFSVNAVVADANDKYLSLAKERGLQTKMCNLEDCDLPDLNLVTMRAVLHYNTTDNQKKF
ncbi:MAG: class I SAM-dependent methyltransferase [Candidatus Paceibacterota bacterium]